MSLPLFVVFILLGWASFTKNVNAVWFNDLWQYRQKVTLGTVTTELVGYQVQLTGINTQALYNAGKLQANCEDLRFTDIDGKLLEYWVEDKGVTCQNSTSTDIWVKTTRLAVGGTTLYMYYGNSTASSYQSARKTFDFFEDFNGVTLDSTVWTNSGSPSLSSGRLQLLNDQAIRSFAEFSANTRIIMRASQPSTALNTAIMGLSNTVLASPFNTDDSLGFNFDSTTGSNFEVMLSNDGTTATNNTSLAENTADNEFELGWAPSTITYFINNTSRGSSSVSGNIANEPVNIRIQNSSATDTFSVDWVGIAKYASSLPATVSFDTEEKGRSPIVYLSFDEGQGQEVRSTAGKGLIGYLGGSASVEAADPVWRDDCIKGNCLYFDGTNDILDIAHDAIMNLGTGDFTVSMWAKYPSQVGGTFNYSMLVTKASNPNPPYEGLTVFVDEPTNANLQFRVNSANALSTTVGGLNNYEWKHFIFRRQGTELRVYVNGKSIASGTVASININNTAPLRFGSNHIVTTSQNYQGYIDEFKLWNVALTEAEILQQYNSTSTVIGESKKPQINGQVAWWKMDEALWNGTSGEVKDAGGLGMNGTSTGSAAVGVGKYGNGGSLNGSTAYVNVADNSYLDRNDIGLSLWVNRAVSTGFHGIIAKDTNAVWNGQTNYQLLFTNGGAPGTTANGALELRWETSGGGKVVANTQGVAFNSTNTWYHIAANRWQMPSGEYAASLFVNGVEQVLSCYFDPGSGWVQYECNKIPGTVVHNNGNFQIGRYGGGQYFNGRIDEVRVFSRALNAEEAQTLTQYLPSVIQHWKFDERTGNTAKTSAIGGVDTTLTNMENTDWVTGVRGNALTFDGVDEYASAGNLVSSALRQFTFSWWVNVNSFTNANYMSLFCQAEGVYPSSLNNFCFYAGNGASAFGLQGKWSDGTALDARTNIPFGTSTWKMITVTYDGTTLRQYVDGKQINSVSYANKSLANANTFTIGRGYAYPSALVTTYFDGKIDDFKVYNYAMSAVDILADYSNDASLSSSETGLIRHYQMEELGWNGTTGEVIDSSGYSNHGTAMNGATTSTMSKIGLRAGQLDGNNDWINIGDPGSDVQTIAFWFNTSNAATDKRLLSATNGGTGKFSLRFSSNTLQAWDGGVWRTISTAFVTTGTWYHVALVFGEGGNGVTTYINGVQDGSSSATFNNFSANFGLGVIFQGSHGGYYSGYIDDFRFYTEPVDTATITRLSSNDPSAAQRLFAGSEIKAPTALIHLKMDEKSGTTAINNGTMLSSGNATLNNFSSTPWRFGKIGNSLLFDGTDDFVSTPDHASFVWGNAVTVSTWFKTGSITTAKSLVAKTGESSGMEFHLSLETDGRVRCWVSNNGTASGTFAYSRAVNYTDNTWHFASCVYNGSTLQVQVDGHTGTAVARTGAIFNGTQPLTIGGNTAWTGANWMFNGQIDNVKIWNSALSIRDIMVEYNQGRPLHWWNFDSGEGTVSYDIASKINGTMTNFTPSTAWRSGADCKLNKCLQFDGINDYITTPPIYIGTEYTISGWFKTSAAHAGGGDIFALTSSGSLHGVLIEMTGGEVRFLHRMPTGNIGGPNIFSPLTNYNNGQWHHFVATGQGSGAMNLYLDGRLVGTNTTGAPFMQTLFLTMGRLSQTSDTRYFNGMIDEIKVFPYAFNETDVKVDYNLGAALRFE